MGRIHADRNNVGRIYVDRQSGDRIHVDCTPTWQTLPGIDPWVAPGAGPV